MDSQIATAIILVLCLALILITYVLGVEVGQASRMRAHPGYETSAVAPAQRSAGTKRRQ